MLAVVALVQHWRIRGSAVVMVLLEVVGGCYLRASILPSFRYTFVPFVASSFLFTRMYVRVCMFCGMCVYTYNLVKSRICSAPMASFFPFVSSLSQQLFPFVTVFPFHTFSLFSFLPIPSFCECICLKS